MTDSKSEIEIESINIKLTSLELEKNALIEKRDANYKRVGPTQPFDNNEFHLELVAILSLKTCFSCPK